MTFISQLFSLVSALPLIDISDSGLTHKLCKLRDSLNFEIPFLQ